MTLWNSNGSKQNKKKSNKEVQMDNTIIISVHLINLVVCNYLKE